MKRKLSDTVKLLWEKKDETPFILKKLAELIYCSPHFQGKLESSNRNPEDTPLSFWNRDNNNRISDFYYLEIVKKDPAHFLEWIDEQPDLDEFFYHERK